MAAGTPDRRWLALAFGLLAALVLVTGLAVVAEIGARVYTNGGADFVVDGSPWLDS